MARRLRCSAPRDGISCVAFDLDGTFYPRSLYYSEYVRLARHALRELAGLSRREASELLRAWRIGGRGRDRGSVTALIESVGIERPVWAEYLDSSWDIASLVRPDAALVGAVTALNAALPVVLVTNNSERNAARLLRALGFSDGALPVVAPSAARRPKPAVDILVEAARRLGVLASEIFSVGDRWSVDVGPVLELGGGGIEVETTADVVVVSDVLATDPTAADPALVCARLRSALAGRAL
jgi:FMN phosphatase YigB (HAD superfamily)